MPVNPFSRQDVTHAGQQVRDPDGGIAGGESAITKRQRAGVWPL